MNQEALLAGIKSGDWLNKLKRDTGFSEKSIRKIARDNGLTIRKAPQEAMGKSLINKPDRAQLTPVMTPEAYWKGQKANARWTNGR